MLHRYKGVISTRGYNICKYLGAPKYINQILTDLKGKIDGNVIIVVDFIIPLIQRIYYPDRKSVSKIIDLKWHVRQTYITCIHSSTPKQQKTNSSQLHMEYFPGLIILGHKTSQ